MTKIRRVLNSDVILIAFIFLSAILLLVFPEFIRSLNDMPVLTGEAYYDLRISNAISENGLLWYDYLQDRPYTFNLYHYALAGLNSFFNEKAVVFLIPLLLGILSILLFLLILKHFGVNENIVFFSLFIFVLSPVFLFLYTNLNKYSFAVVLGLATFLTFISKKPYFAVLLLIFIPLIDFSSYVLVVLILFFYTVVREKLKPFIFSVALSLIGIIIAIRILNYTIPFDFLIKRPVFSEVLTSFGALIGVSVFTLFLALLGFIYLWKKKKEYLFFNLSFIVLLFISFFNDSARIFLNFFLSGFAGLTFFLLIKRDWAIVTIKKFTILLIFCSLIFSTSVYINGIITSQPSKELVDALVFLKDYKETFLSEESIVFGHPSYGFFIEYFSMKKSFLDDNSFMQEDYESLKKIADKIFYSRDLDSTEIILKEQNIKYFLITPEMKKGLVWKKPDEGFLFLLENSKSFVNVYNNQDFEIWTYSKLSCINEKK